MIEGKDFVAYVVAALMVLGPIAAGAMNSRNAVAKTGAASITSGVG